MTETKIKNRKTVILSTFWKQNLYFLKKKIQFYVRSLKRNKKRSILLLEASNSLFKSIRDLSSLVIQDSTSTERKKSNGIHEINRERTNSTNRSEQSTTRNNSNPNSVSTKNSVMIVGDSIVKNLRVPGISKKSHVKIKKRSSCNN